MTDRLAYFKAMRASYHDFDDEDVDGLIRLVEEARGEVERLRGLLGRLEVAIDGRLEDLESKPHLPYWAGVAAAYADVHKLLRDPDWLAAALNPADPAP